MEIVEFTQVEFNELKKLVKNFYLYYENKDDVWNFNNLEDQRQLACGAMQILADKFLYYAI
jgi:hypothetical protein